MPQTDYFRCDYFELFGLPRSMQVDLAALAATFRALQQRFHPDQIAESPLDEQLHRQLSVTLSSRLNDAHETLKEPLSRAAYMLLLAGRDVYSESETLVEPAFLEQQMEWREQLEELSTDAQKQQLRADVAAEYQQVAQRTEQALDEGRVDDAYAAVRQWIYLKKLLSAIDKHGSSG